MDARTRHRTNARNYQRRNRSEGLCVLCPDLAVSKDYCAKHQRMTNAAKRERHGGAQVERTCPSCGQYHHNSRTCPLNRYLADHAETAMAA